MIYRVLTFCLLLLFVSCGNETQPIEFGKDMCAFCKMTAIDKKFGAELINSKGKTVKFDSGECMINYLKTYKDFKPVNYLVINYDNPGELIDAEKSYYLHGGSINSPMGGQLAAFKTREAAVALQARFTGEVILWNTLVNLNF
jgi:copper chaperone NosL